eukprot:CAMPEP_0196136918 /NCGR_PEP_ID=MMETSP0910-20130528/5063_1 /TAXON_ID=49265 /ORGANISM="Thalassiosira rotula, Strain GSO102" /LENGTH=209 /DNA_ID=CAMNT_0041397283 /DNA_START=183 /DNA_END=812 /DNA_ORIENTATION=+
MSPSSDKTNKDNLVGVNEKVENTKSNDHVKDIIEPSSAASSSGLHPHRVSACYHQADLDGYLSPIPWDSFDDTIKNKSMEVTPTSLSTSSSLSQDTMTLAKLYQSSRRSRPIISLDDDCDDNGNDDYSQPISIYHDDHVCPNNYSTLIEAWSFDIDQPAVVIESCSSSSNTSVSSMEFKEVMTQEAVKANELFGEDLHPPKRRKVTPGQ